MLFRSEITSTLPVDSTLFLGGRCDNFANFEGRLDEVAVFDRALTSGEVASHFALARRQSSVSCTSWLTGRRFPPHPGPLPEERENPGSSFAITAASAYGRADDDSPSPQGRGPG